MVSRFPLRSDLGRVLRATHARLRVQGVPRDAVDFIHASSLPEVLNLDHRSFFPILEKTGGGVLAKPAEGIGRIPPAVVLDHYHLPKGSYFAIRINPKDLNAEPPETASVSIDLGFAEQNQIGGVAMMGNPFLLRGTGPVGYGYGLPGEVTLTPMAERYARFIDSDQRWTEQIAEGWGGLQFVQPPQMRTDRLVITLGNFPKIAASMTWPDGAVGTKPGLLVALLFVYEKAHNTRHLPIVAVGLSGVDRSAKIRPSKVQRGWRTFQTGADLVAPQGADLAGQAYYLHYSAAAPITGPRAYEGVEELWGSGPMKTGDWVEFHLVQAEEHSRTLAAASFDFGSRAPGSGGRPRIRIEVWTVDPGPDQPAVQRAEAPGAKRVRQVIGAAEFSGVRRHEILRFDRPVTSHRILVRLTNLSADRSIITVKKLILLRSHGPVIGTRSVYHQWVDRMHYRIIGEGLADDYGRIGPHGASIRVEVEDGRGGRAELMRADNLLDLTRAGGQLIANSRQEYDTKTVNQERSVILASDEVRETGTSREAWRASQMGDKVKWKDRPRPIPPGVETDPEGPFQTYGSSENRTQTEMVGHESAGGDLAAIGEILDLVGLPSSRMGFRQNFDSSGNYLLNNLPPRLLEEEAGHSVSWNDTWGEMTGLDYIGTVRTFTLPSYYYQIDDVAGVISGIAGLESLQGGISEVLQDPIAASGDLFNQVQPVLEYMTGVIGATLGSISFSFGGQMIGGASISASLGGFMPQLSSASAEGTTGSIAKTANRTVHNHSQSLETGFDHSVTRSVVKSGETTRRVEMERDEGASERGRKTGAEIHWNGKRTDVLTGTLALGISLPAIADEVYDTLDRLLRVRLDMDPEDDTRIDIWFDITETLIEEDF